jgi:hypothetical protein
MVPSARSTVAPLALAEMRPVELCVNMPRVEKVAPPSTRMVPALDEEPVPASVVRVLPFVISSVVPEWWHSGNR